MDLNWIKTAKIRQQCHICIRAVLEGLKVFWLVDEIHGQDRDRLAGLVTKLNLSSVEIFDEFFIFNPSYLSKLKSIVPRVIDIPLRIVSDFDHAELISDLIGSVQSGRVPILDPVQAHLTPTLIGYLLGYPVLYQLGPDGKCDWLNSLPLILFQVHLDDVIISSFSLPAECLSNLSDLLRDWEGSLDPALHVTKTEICLPDVNL